MFLVIYERHGNDYVRKVKVEQNQPHAKVLFEEGGVYFLVRTGKMPPMVSLSDMKLQSLKREVLRGPDALPPRSQFERFVTDIDVERQALAVKVVCSQRQERLLLTYVPIGTLD